MASRYGVAISSKVPLVLPRLTHLLFQMHREVRTETGINIVVYRPCKHGIEKDTSVRHLTCRLQMSSVLLASHLTI